MLQRKLMSFPTALDLSIYLLLSCFVRKGPLVPVHRSAGDPSSQPAHRHDGVRMMMVMMMMVMMMTMMIMVVTPM